MNRYQREDILRRVTTALRVAGIVVMVLGLICLPLSIGVSPKRDLSAFNNLVDLGFFWKPGLVLLAVGAVMVIVSWLLTGVEGEPR